MTRPAAAAACCIASLALCSCKGSSTPVEEPAPPVAPVPEPEVPAAGGTDFSRHWDLSVLDVPLEVPAHDLPLAQDDIHNHDRVTSRIPLSDEASQVLRASGLVVIDNPFGQQERVSELYEAISDHDVPVFVTTDSLLHLYHIQFAETLRIVEEQSFYPDLWSISQRLLERSLEQHETHDGEIREAARRNAAYLAVALELLDAEPDQICAPGMGACTEALFGEAEAADYSFEPPGVVAAEVEKEIAAIRMHAGMDTSAIFTYEEDYSQYVPRGHYTRSAKLENYFLAMTWYGRMAMLLVGGPNGLVGETDARIQTMQAALLTHALAGEPELMRMWERIYAVTSFYVGFSDDLGPPEYATALEAVFAGAFEPSALDAAAVDEMKATLATYRSPAIQGGTGGCAIEPPFTAEQAEKCLEQTAGFRLMGQRFIPDSYLFSNLVSPHVGTFVGDDCPGTFTCAVTDAGPWRVIPRGLDVMALLGSTRADHVLAASGDAEYSDYDEQRDVLAEEFQSFDERRWHQSLYFAWLESLAALLGQYPEGYPPFMRTLAWEDKQLNTALASWAELRHDTVLYAKQSYTVGVTSAEPGAAPPEEPVVGYVEPVPHFYNRLLALTRMTNQGLEELGVLDSLTKGRLEQLERILAQLVAISVRELANEELTEEDHELIESFGEALTGVIAGVDDETLRTTMAADVHTDVNTGQVLQETVGRLDLLVVAYVVPDGRVLLGAGPVLTHYEFLQPMGERLTDERWREMLSTDPPDLASWHTGRPR
jgi:hypothetical protein